MNLSNVSILTKRLKIIPTNELYAQKIFDELTPTVATYLSFDPSGKIEDTLIFIRTSQEKIIKGVDMPVVVLDKNTGEFIGCSGLHKLDTKKPELGIWIKQSAQKKGYGKEIIQGLIDWAEEHLDFEYLIYPVVKDNLPSRKLIESLGGVLSGSQIYTSPSGKVLDEVEYRIPYK